MNENNPRQSLAGTGAGVYVCMNKPKITLNVLIACEESQAECNAFRQLGHNAFSCDIQPCRKGGNPEWHIQSDVTPLLRGGTTFVTQSGLLCTVPRWDLIIAHPPCTYLCKMGSVHLYKNPDTYVNENGRDLYINLDRYKRMVDAHNFFHTCLSACAKYVAVENPIPMRLAHLPKPSCYACPSWFGVKYTKKTLYWLKNLPPILAEYIHGNPKCYVTSSRGKYRSRTFPQMAMAIAKQWSEYVINDMIKNKADYELKTIY